MMYQVGQRVPQFKGTDGVYLTIDESGVFLLCRMARPTSQERRAFNSSQPIQIGMGVCEGILFWTVRFGELDAMDCTYSTVSAGGAPSLAVPGDGQGYALMVILADGDTGEVIRIRLIGLPHDFSVAMRDMVADIAARPINYPFAIARLYRLSTEELDELATVRCILARDGGQDED